MSTVTKPVLKSFSLALPIAIGTQLVVVLTSLVNYMIIPHIVYRYKLNQRFIVLQSGPNGPSYDNSEEASADNAVITNIGGFYQTLSSFFVVSLIMFLLIWLLHRSSFTV